MTQHRIFKTPFAKVYPMYVQKAERKNRTKDEVDEVIRWLTGYSQGQLQQQIDADNDFGTFFAQASMNPRSELIRGVVCGIRVEDVDDPLMQKIRYGRRTRQGQGDGKDPALIRPATGDPMVLAARRLHASP
ncbi:MAG: DUF2200 domain-containing protein [Xanthomonadales bacterium]|nr:DUF2200 domain-containing protein [Xanthomonadales bacterium]